MRRDHYSEVSARIVGELERGAAPWIPISTGQGSYDKLNTEVAAGVKTDVEQRFGSASTIGPLKEAWSEEHARWSKRDLSACSTHPARVPAIL